jgi:glycosyltransferase involved in cell wall biosynthesis
MGNAVSFPARSVDGTEGPRLRVLIVVAGGLRDRGGVTRCMENLIESWMRLPVPPDYRIVDPRGVGSIYRAPFHMLRAMWVVFRESLRDGPTIIHANMCENGSTLRKLPIVWLARTMGASSLIHLHGAEIKAMFDRLPRWLRRVFRFGVARADCIVVLGTSWRDFMCRDVGIRKEQVVCIPNAIAIPAAARSTPADGACRLLFLGRLEERKGADCFLQALASPQLAGLDFKAVMAGDGRVDVYREMARTLGLGQRVAFPGWVERDAVADLMLNSDVLVLPSLNEGLPMAILEAMAYGLTVVTTPVGAITDVIRDDDTGVLVPPANPTALAAALRRVIGDPNLRLRLGCRARALARAEFDVDRYGERFVRLYDEILAGRSGVDHRAWAGR